MSVKPELPLAMAAFIPALRGLQSRGREPLLWVLTFLFALRVVGQAIQRWTPRSFLPPFDAFQGSNLPYFVLLGSQIVTLGAMVFFNLRRPLSPMARRALFWFGCFYMAGSLARIVVGLAVPGAPAWFSTWIPAAFHVVLAGYVLTLGCYRTETLQKP